MTRRLSSFTTWLRDNLPPDIAEQQIANLPKDMLGAEVIRHDDGTLTIVLPDSPPDAPNFSKPAPDWQRVIDKMNKCRLPADASILEARKLPVQPPIYVDLLPPTGLLPPKLAAHALWTYYTWARLAFENHDTQRSETAVSYEGEPSANVNYRQLLTNVARMYGMDPDYLPNWWPVVDAQATALQLPLLPHRTDMRFTSTLEAHNDSSND